MSYKDLTTADRPRRFRTVRDQQAPKTDLAAHVDADRRANQPDLLLSASAAKNRHELAKAVIDRTGHPVSALTVAAFLESQGWTNADAQANFGCSTLLALGHEIWQDSWSGATSTFTEKDSTFEKSYLNGEGLQLRGPYILALAIIQLMALAFTTVGFGAGGDLSAFEATAVGLGLLLGLVWANGFSQLMARDPLNLHLQGHEVLAGLAAFRIIGIALGVVAIPAIIGSGLCFLYACSIPGALSLAVSYFLLITWFWLAVNTLFVLDLAPVTLIAAMLAVVIFIAIQAFLPSGVTHQAAPGVALVLANLLMSAALLWWWIAKRRQGRPSRLLPLLKGAVVNQSGYCLYGFGVMLLAVLDRMVAWRTGAAAGSLTFQVQYEVGLGWALLAFLISMMGQEWLLGTFMRRWRQTMSQHALGDKASYRQAMLHAYWGRVSAAIAIAVVSSILVASLIAWAPAWLQRITPEAEGLVVFRWGLIGYGLLSVAFFSTGIAISLSRPGRLAIPLLLALVVDLIVAWYAAQTLTYVGSVFGLIAGAAVLLVGSVIQVTALLKSPANSPFSGA